MKTKLNNYRRLFIGIFILLTSSAIKIYGQDSPNPANSLNDTKLSLIEYKQKLLEAKIELLESKAPQKDLNLKKRVDSISHILNKHKNNIFQDTMRIKPFTKAITFNVTRIFEGTLQLNYEKAIKKNLSFEVSLLGTYVTQRGIGGGYLQNQVLGFSDMATNSYVSYYGKMINGLGGIVRLKNYLLTRVNSKSNAPIGLYAAPQLMYRRIWITGNQYGGDYYPMIVQKEITRNLDVIQGGVILGSKFVIAKVLCLDVYMGGVMRLSKYYNESTFTKYKKWNNIDYSGILPTVGINIGILK